MKLHPFVCAAALAAAAVFAAPAFAQEEAAAAETAPEQPATAAQPEAADDEVEEIIVVGTQIKGAQVDEILPVTVLDESDIELIGADSSDELFRNLPEVGDINFNQETATHVNSVRGDTASINLRSFGTGNTLLLLNGRRLVNHPGYKTERIVELVPVVSPNTNALPVLGVQRLEVLRDGASAIYGADAVAGVINTVLKDDFEGLTLNVRGRTYEELKREDFSVALEYGWHSEDEGTRIGVFANYYNREPVQAAERVLSQSRDHRPLVVGTPFEGAGGFRSTSTDTSWGVFDIRQGVTGELAALTSSGGRFHIQPVTNPGCRATLGDTGACIDNSSAQHTSAANDENLRFNRNTTATLSSALNRRNLMFFVNHEIQEGLEFFGEVSYYNADTRRTLYPSIPLTAARFFIPAKNYWNPFGPAQFEDGRNNPNRLPASVVDNIPAEGVDIQLRDYRVVDAGPRVVEVDNDSWRTLGGFRGTLFNWDWEGAIFWSRSTNDDITHNRISNTLFQQALNNDTPNAYNPFNGAGTIECSMESRDCTPNPQAVIDTFLIDVFRRGESSLVSGDFRISRGDLYELPAGPIGVALGVEWRRETYVDDRDPRLDSTIQFRDVVTGIQLDSISDVMHSSPTNDSQGSRRVFSSYAEFAVPLVDESFGLPLVQNVDMQLAARYEDFNDVGSIVVPKVALLWRLHEFVMLRGAFSEGFRAPNLVQINERALVRSNTRDDHYRCAAQLRKNEITDIGDCASNSVQRHAAGNQNLVPEESENYNLGIVFEPNFAFAQGLLSGLTLTADYWKVEKEGTVSIFGENNHILLDTLIRKQNQPADVTDAAACAGVAGNPAVMRDAPDSNDVNDFAGSGLCATGEVTQVFDTYVNIDDLNIEGWDFGVYYALETDVGEFDFKFNTARINKFFVAPGPQAQQLLAAQNTPDPNVPAGAAEQAQTLIPTDVTVSGAQSLLEINGRPKLQYTGSIRWRLNEWGAGTRIRHVGEFIDTSVTSGGARWRVDDWTTLSADVYRKFELYERELRLRLGITNLTNEDAPLGDELFGYFGSLHNNLGRSFYLDARLRF